MPVSYIKSGPNPGDIESDNSWNYKRAPSGRGRRGAAPKRTEAEIKAIRLENLKRARAAKSAKRGGK